MPMETPRRRSPTGTRAPTVLTLWSSTQVPNSVKSDVCSRTSDLPENAVRVHAPDVGGAFGVKLQIYPEEIAGLLAGPAAAGAR